VADHAGRSWFQGWHVTRALLASTALVGIGLAANPAAAADGIELGAGGFFRNTYLADTDTRGAPNTGSFDEVGLGANAEARSGLCVVPPGSTDIFPALSPSQTAAEIFPFGSMCGGAGERTDAQALGYVTPDFGAFHLTLSGGQNSVAGPYDDETSALIGMPRGADPQGSDDVRLYGSYSLEGDGWGLTAGAGASFEGQIEQQAILGGEEHERYQAGVNVTLGNVAVGGVFEYFKAIIDRGPTDLDRWVAGAGIAYSLDDWTVGAQYSRLDQDSSNPVVADDVQQDRVTLTGNYELGPGIDIDGQVGYTWIETGPDSGTANSIDSDDYPALEIGIGTNFTF
jgi:outer membrane protein OmpU